MYLRSVPVNNQILTRGQMAAPTDYLKQRGRSWYVQVQIPAHLRNAAGGKWAYVKSLKTRDLNEASRRKHPYVAAFKQRIAALERQHKNGEQPSEWADMYEKALGGARRGNATKAK